MQDIQKSDYADINFYRYSAGGLEKVLILHDFASDKQSMDVNLLVESLIKQNFNPILIDLPFHGEDNSEGVFDYETAVKKLERFLWFPNILSFPVHDISIFAFGLSAFFALNSFKGIENYDGTIFLYSPSLNYDEELLNMINKQGFKKKDLESGEIELGENRKVKVNLTLLRSLKENTASEKQNSPNIYVFYPKDEKNLKIKNNEKLLKKYKKVTIKTLNSDRNQFDEVAESMMAYIKGNYSYYTENPHND